MQDLGANAVVTQVGGEAQAGVRFDRVGAVVLPVVGADLVQQADAAAFLPQVHEYAASFVSDSIERSITLDAAVAAQAVQRVTRQAFGVSANQHRLCSSYLTECPCDVLATS